MNCTYCSAGGVETSGIYQGLCKYCGETNLITDLATQEAAIIRQLQVRRLPDFSRRVYDTLDSLLYAESGFSDVTGEDVAEKMGVRPSQVGGAVKRLVELGLVEVEEFDDGEREINYLHTVAHYNDER